MTRRHKCRFCGRLGAEHLARSVTKHDGRGSRGIGSWTIRLYYCGAACVEAESAEQARLRDEADARLRALAAAHGLDEFQSWARGGAQ